MRTTCLLLALLISPALVTAPHAQEKHHGRPAEPARPAQLPSPPPARPPSSMGSIGWALPSIGLNLPPIGLNQPPIGLNQPPIAFTQPPIAFGQPPLQQYPTGRPSRQPKRDGHGRHDRWGSSVVYVTPYAWSGGSIYDTAPPPSTSGVTVFTPESLTGGLRLEIEPAQWQLFVDGVFVGSQEDLGNEIELQAGSRRIELRAPGYHALIFDARIEADRDITYRGRLEPLAADARAAAPRAAEPPASPPPPAVATGSKTLYMIPGCYVGNVMPQKERLRDGCDVSNLKTITP